MPRRGQGAKAQRTDLNKPSIPKVQPPQADATGRPFGAAAADLRAQQVVPLPNNAAPPVGPSPGGAAPSQPMAEPGSFGAFDRPTERPNEPIMTGAGSPEDTTLTDLQGVYARYPNPDLLALIAELLDRQRPATRPR